MSASAPLTDAYRILRLVAPPDSPFSGRLAARSDGSTVLLVDVQSLADWPGWRVDPDGHLLAVGDLVRRPDGVDVELAHCTQRVDRLLDGRAQTQNPLLPGEAVTLAVSMIRGLGELRAIEPGREWAEGAWWLTDAGRPLFVAGSTGGQPADEATRIALGRTARECSDAAVGEAVARAAEELGDPRSFLHASAELEEALFAVAQPTPIETAPHAPVRVRDLSPAEDIHVGERAPRGLHGILAGELGEALTSAGAETMRRLRGRVRLSRRARPLLVGGAVAAGVLIVGALWPASPEAPAAQGAPRSSAAPSSSPLPTAADAVAGADIPGDLALVTGELLDRRSDCAEDAECLADVVEDPGRRLPAGAIDLDPPRRAVTLLDEFGGVAVLRVDGDAPGTGAQLVVIVAAEHGWMIRDVHDVADQTG